jgi:electron transport complex protein RnfC
MGPSGATVPAVEIASDGEDTADESLTPIEDWRNAAPERLKERIVQAGIVGLGGAAFPTAVKLSPPPAKPIDVLILNGVECEPYLTADHRLMLERPDTIVDGALIIARVLGVKTVIIGIELNKPDAIEIMRAGAKNSEIEVQGLRVQYPQGAEKQLIYALTGRKVPTAGLPMDVGCVVQNVGTAAAVADAVLRGKSLYERVTTVTGTPVATPGNWRLRVGTPYSEALALAGGVNEDPAKLISGGPMMGMSVYSLDIPIMKSTSGLLLLGRDELTQFESTACIRCGRCVDNCPMALMPGTLSVQIETEHYDLAEAWHALDCIECGCCAYGCPAHRPLVQHMRRAKGEIMARRRAAQAKKK